MLLAQYCHVNVYLFDTPYGGDHVAHRHRLLLSENKRGGLYPPRCCISTPVVRTATHRIATRIGREADGGTVTDGAATVGEAAKVRGAATDADTRQQRRLRGS